MVAGIFIYSMLILTGVLDYSGFAASLALVVILLPSVTRVVEEVLRVVPSGLREASQALGAPEWRTVWSVVLPDGPVRCGHGGAARHRPDRGGDGTAALHRLRLPGE